jgi:hypothetical protein
MQTSSKLMIAVILTLAAAAQGQKKLSAWELDNAVIGPDSPIHLTPGSSYTAQIMLPNPDGPLTPLKTQVAWSLESPVTGVTINRQSGKIEVAKEATNGMAAKIVAHIDHGRRVLKSSLFIFTREANPLIGEWTVESLLACGDGHEMKPDAGVKAPLARDHLRFQVSSFWIGLENNIAAHTTLTGAYEYDLKSGMLTLKPTWPKGKPPVVWNYQLSEDGHKLAIKTSAPEDPGGQVCGYVYRQSTASAFVKGNRY